MSAGVHQVVEAPLARHSEKPPTVRERIVRLAGDVSRIELFARTAPPGWDVWGNDVRLDAEPDGARPALRPDSSVQRASRGSPAERERVLRHLERHGPTGRVEIDASLGLEPGAVRALLARLLRDGILVRQGRTRATRYSLAAEPAARPRDVPGQLPLPGSG